MCMPLRVLGPHAQLGPCWQVACAGTNKARLTASRCRANLVPQRGSCCRLALWLMPSPVSHHEPFVNRVVCEQAGSGWFEMSWHVHSFAWTWSSCATRPMLASCVSEADCIHAAAPTLCRKGGAVADLLCG